MFGSPKEVMSHELPEKYNVDLIMVGQSGLNAVERGSWEASVATLFVKHLAMS